MLFGKEIDGAFSGFAVGADVGNRVHPLAGGGVDRAQGGRQLQTGQEVLLHIADAVLDAALFVDLAHVAGTRGEAVMGREVEVSQIEDGVPAHGMDEHAGLEVVDDDLAGDGTERFKGIAVTGQEVFEGFAGGELDVDHPAVGEYHDEEGESPTGGAELDRSGAAPVHLRGLAGRECEGEKREGWRTGRTARTYCLMTLKPPS